MLNTTENISKTLIEVAIIMPSSLNFGPELDMGDFAKS